MIYSENKPIPPQFWGLPWIVIALWYLIPGPFKACQQFPWQPNDIISATVSHVSHNEGQFRNHYLIHHTGTWYFADIIATYILVVSPVFLLVTQKLLCKSQLHSYFYDMFKTLWLQM